MTAVENTARRLRELIREKGITYAELERLSGVPKSAIQRYASGETKKIPLDRIFRISEALGVSPYDLVGNDKPWGTDQSISQEYARWEFGVQHPYDPDPWSEREALRDDPDRRALLDLARNGSAEDVRQVAAIIDALRATNPAFYDGDDPA